MVSSGWKFVIRQRNRPDPQCNSARHQRARSALVASWNGVVLMPVKRWPSVVCCRCALSRSIQACHSLAICLISVPAFFRSNRELQNEVELLITVTPNFAGPMDPCEVPAVDLVLIRLVQPTKNCTGKVTWKCLAARLASRWVCPWA